MSAGEIAAVVAAGAAVVLVVVVTWIAVAVNRTLGEARGALVDIRREAVPLLSETRSTIRQANGELEKVGDLLETANSVGGTVDSASKLAYTVVSNPVIKAAALGSGILRGARSLKAKRTA